MRALIILTMVMLLPGCIVTEAINEVTTDFKWRDIKNAEYWRNVVHTPEEAKQWISYNINYDEAAKWISHDIKTPSLAAPWIASNIHKDCIFSYLAAGISSIQIAEKWQSAIKRTSSSCKSDIKQALFEYKNAGINNPDNVIALRKYGFDRVEIISYVTFGVGSLEQAKEWKQAGVTVAQINDWKSRGLTINQAIDELTTNFAWKQLDPENATYWKDTGLTPDEAKVWVDAKIPDAPFWIDAGITDINEAKKWLKAGFTDAHKWVRDGFKELNDAKKWKKLGVDLGLAYKIKNETNLSSDGLIKSCGIVLETVDFMSGNPYKHVNKCVSTCIDVQQILSANEVFAQTFYKPARMISATAPNALTDDFVVNKLACGIYKIETAEQFELTDGRVVMGNTFKRLARHSM